MLYFQEFLVYNSLVLMFIVLRQQHSSNKYLIFLFIIYHVIKLNLKIVQL